MHLYVSCMSTVPQRINALVGCRKSKNCSDAYFWFRKTPAFGQWGPCRFNVLLSFWSGQVASLEGFKMQVRIRDPRTQKVGSEISQCGSELWTPSSLIDSGAQAFGSGFCSGSNNSDSNLRWTPKVWIRFVCKTASSDPRFGPGFWLVGQGPDPL